MTDFSNEAYISLATYRRDGREVRTPVWVAQSGSRLYVFSEGEAGKVKRIRATGGVRVAACNYRGVVRGSWSEGQGRVLEEEEQIEEAYALLNKKYGWKMVVTDFFSKMAGRFDKRALLEITLE